MDDAVGLGVMWWHGLGDIVGYCPEPGECVQTECGRFVKCVLVNHEAMLISVSSAEECDEFCGSVGWPLKIPRRQPGDSEGMNGFTVCPSSLRRAIRCSSTFPRTAPTVSPTSITGKTQKPRLRARKKPDLLLNASNFCSSKNGEQIDADLLEERAGAWRKSHPTASALVRLIRRRWMRFLTWSPCLHSHPCHRPPPD